MENVILYAHPNPKSFNHAIKATIENILVSKKKGFVVRDLYQLQFNPKLAGDDFVLFKQGKVAPDLETEQEMIRKAKTLVCVFPIWWFSMPAILKGYIDRVFSYGFAYRYGEKGLEGLLGGKKVILINTTGGSRQQYESAGFNEALKKTIAVGTFGLCAMEVVLHKFFYGVPTVNDASRKAMLEELKTISF